MKFNEIFYALYYLIYNIYLYAFVVDNKMCLSANLNKDCLEKKVFPITKH